MKTISNYINYEVLDKVDGFWLLRLIKLYLFGSSSKRAIFLYRLSQYTYQTGYRRIATFFSRKLEIEYGVYIDPASEVGIGFRMPHPNGIVVGSGSVLGKGVTIFQQVTLGGARIGDSQKGAYPSIGDNCILFAGAKVIGEIKIGNNCIIAANAVVIKDVPDNCTAVGVPAINKQRGLTCDEN